MHNTKLLHKEQNPLPAEKSKYDVQNFFLSSSSLNTVEQIRKSTNMLVKSTLLTSENKHNKVFQECVAPSLDPVVSS